MELNLSFNQLIAKSIVSNWDYDALTDYKGATLQYKDVARKIEKIHPKMADGSWYEPYNPFLANHRDGVGDFTEGNGWQYTYMVPQLYRGQRLAIHLHGAARP